MEKRLDNDWCWLSFFLFLPNEVSSCGFVCFGAFIRSKRANETQKCCLGRQLAMVWDTATYVTWAAPSCLYSFIDGNAYVTWSTVVADILREPELIAVMTVHGLSCHRCGFALFFLSPGCPIITAYSSGVDLFARSQTVGSGPLGQQWRRMSNGWGSLAAVWCVLVILKHSHTVLTSVENITPALLHNGGWDLTLTSV